MQKKSDVSTQHATQSRLELAYVEFSPNSADIPPAQECIVTHFIGTVGSGRWRETHTRIPGITDPLIPTPIVDANFQTRLTYHSLVVAGKNGLLAFNAVFNKREVIVLVFPDNSYTLLPIEFPSDYELFGIEIAEDARTLMLLYVNPSMNRTEIRIGAVGFLTRFLKWDDHRRLTEVQTINAWFACADPQFALLVNSSGKPFSYDLRSLTRYQNPDKERAGIEVRLAALLVERKSPRVWQPGTHRPSGPSLPSGGDSLTAGYVVSNSATAMFEECLDITNPASPENIPSFDWRNNHTYDAVFVPQRGITWTIRRALRYANAGFQFTNAAGTSLRFMCLGYFTMGKSRPAAFRADSSFYTAMSALLRYPPGIYDVDLLSQSVRHTPLPPRMSHDALVGSVRAASIRLSYSESVNYMMCGSGLS